jgi:hypothetical protein
LADSARFRAAGLHFTISAIVGLLLACVIWFIIYPPPLLEALGGDKVFLMLLGIDIVLGPLLTFVVFKVGKKTLKFDLAIIVALQIGAMVYGLSVLWQGRPIYLAALGHRFDAVQAMDVQGASLISSQTPLFGPKWVGTEKSKDPKKHEEIHTAAIGGLDYGHYPEFHVPLENISVEIKSKAKPISELKKLNPGREAEVDAWLISHGTSAEKAIFQGMRTRGRDLTVFMHLDTAKVIGVGVFLPW